MRKKHSTSGVYFHQVFFCFVFDFAGVFDWVLSTMFGFFLLFFISPGVLIFLYIVIVGDFQTVGECHVASLV